MTDDFKDYPKSIGEARSDKLADAGQWSVRDALISVLRDIDSGKLNPTHAIVVMATDTDQRTTKMDYRHAFPTTFHAVGMLNVAIKDLLA